MPARAPSFAVYAYPWFFGDQGIDASLDELAAIGVDGIQLALSYHVADFVTPRGRHVKVRAGDLGSVWFDHAKALSRESPLDPTLLADAAEAAPHVINGASERGLQVIAWLVFLYTHDLARRRPELAVRNAFGDPHPAQLCPSQPLVRDHVAHLTAAALCLDPTGSSVTGLHAESLSFLPWDYGLLAPKVAVRLGPEASRLLSLCFCGACRARAKAEGVDAEAARSAAREALESWLSGAPTRTPPGSTSAVRAYGAVAAQTTLEVNRAAAQLAAEAGLRYSTTAAEDDDRRPDGTAVAPVRDLVDEVRIKVAAGASPVDLRNEVAAQIAGCRPEARAFAQYQLAAFGNGADLRDAVAAAEEAGIEHHRFYEYSVMTEGHLEWLRSARLVVASS